MADGTFPPKDERFTHEKCRELFRLLIEARDALPAIPLASAKLRNIDLSLADRIDACLEPWKVPPDTPGAL